MTHQLKTQYFLGKPFNLLLDENLNPWFLANNVCEILGYKNPNKSINDHCRPEGVTNRYPLSKKLGGTQYPNFISEGNLYRLIIKSEKPEAEPFEKWIMDEVLPSIRKNGTYSVNSAEAKEDKKYIQSLYRELESLEASNKANNKRIKEIRAIVKEVSLKDYSSPNLFSIGG